ncbi:MAG: trypsin-like serine peptidase [Caulobacteraceae bacterium]
MRLVAAAALIAACVGVSVAAGGAPAPGAYYAPLDLSGATRADIAEPKQDRPGKPPVRGPRDTCRWANDFECDEPDIGTGACPINTDETDCRAIRAGVDDDSCQWANDGECDEPRFGTGQCVQGTDRADCGDLFNLRNRVDSCVSAFNGVCDEPGRGGSDQCEPRTDRSDCQGRARPMAINDHFFGNDDRVRVDVNEAPWRYMGVVRMHGGGMCSATLVASNVVATAAHCLYSDGSLDARGRFTSASGEHNARITAYLVDASYNYIRFSTTEEISGLDWALLRLDRPLGDTLGFASVSGLARDRAQQAQLMQAGYAWDTGDHMAANLSCRILESRLDHTFAHNCDTTRGDSGSGFVVRSGRGFDLIGVDSAFRPNGSGPQNYIAVSASAFAPHAAAFIAGRSGVPADGHQRTKPAE